MEGLQVERSTFLKPDAGTVAVKARAVRVYMCALHLRKRSVIGHSCGGHAKRSHVLTW